VEAGVSNTTYAIIQAIPAVLQLVVAILGLSYSIKGKPSGIPGQMVGGFVVMLVSTVLGLVWQFVSLNVSAWADSGHLTVGEIDSIYLGVDIPLAVLEALAWLLVALAVLSLRRQRQQFGPANYPTGAQPRFAQPGFAQPGLAQPGYQQPGYPQPGYQQQSYPQPGYQQPGYQQPGYQQPGYEQPGYEQPNPGLPPQPPQG
jgi:hypothetical protein